MDALSEHTPWVAGRSPDRGGAGDPSPATAQTVFTALASAAGARLEGRPLSRVTATVVGVGKVGADVARRLAAAGATVHVSDVDMVRSATIAREIDATPLTLDDALRSKVDLLVPCARGAYLTAANVDQLSARVVCGAANNVLAHDDLADRLHAAGVLYVPDFVANSGGIIHVAGEFLGWDRERIAIQVREVGQRVDALLQAAERAGVAPLHIAREMADQRLFAEPVAVAA
jgi:glutamate dehydrogenase/leucine dehydrogenase